MKNSHSDKVIIGISCGDVNGIGLEVILKTFNDPRMLDLCTPVLFAPPKAVLAYKKMLHLNEFNFFQVKYINQIHHKKFNLIISGNSDFEVNPGNKDPLAGEIAYHSLKDATEQLMKGEIDALVTAPIDKHSIQNPEFNFSGHTEYLQEAFNTKEVVMLMITQKLRIGVVTGHVPVQDISKHISKEKIKSKAKVLIDTLKNDFWIEKPKIAILGLNPHAGDGGVIGKEEEQIIQPAIKELQAEGAFAMGPFAADGFFGSKSYEKFDAVLAMYHDQGLIPFKNLSFGEGVNYTAGLPAIRTSPDHGTAYDIAGKNEASESSFRAAIFSAIDTVKKRRESNVLNSNPLAISKLSEEKE
jgi:4-hydroxythreonine-4-phosphate dehydrogenase